MNIDNTIISCVLNFGAKSWWAHNQLRDLGKHVEARREERRNILSDLETMRSALYIPVGSALATCNSREWISLIPLLLLLASCRSAGDGLMPLSLIAPL